MKNILNSVLVLTLLVPAAGIYANDTVEQMVQENANINQEVINNATEQADNQYSVNAPKYIAQTVMPTKRNVVSQGARKVARAVKRVFSSKAREANRERQSDVAIFTKINDAQVLATAQRNSEIAHGVYVPLLESGQITSDEIPSEYRDILARDYFANVNYAPAQPKQGFVARMKNYISDAKAYSMNALDNVKNYVVAKYLQARQDNSKTMFAVKAAGAVVVGIAAGYAIYKGVAYLNNKTTSKKKAAKKKKKVAARRA